jgi:hypothetical protein
MNTELFAFVVAETAIPLSEFRIAPDGDGVNAGRLLRHGVLFRVLLMKKKSGIVLFLEFYMGDSG